MKLKKDVLGLAAFLVLLAFLVYSYLPTNPMLLFQGLVFMLFSVCLALFSIVFLHVERSVSSQGIRLTRLELHNKEFHRSNNQSDFDPSNMESETVDNTPTLTEVQRLRNKN